MLLLPFHLFCAMVRIENMQWQKADQQLKIDLHTDKIMAEHPTLSVKDNMIQLVFKNSYVWPKIEEKVDQDINLMTYQYDKSTVRFRAHLPFAVQENNLSLQCQEKNCHLLVPLLVKGDTEGDEKILGEIKKSLIKEDEVRTTLSAAKRDGLINSYILKFAGLIIAVLSVFLFVANLFRKIILRRGKFSFFHQTKMINLVSTFHVAPKKTLNVITVNDEAFLISIDEQGIKYLTKLDNIAPQIKKSEQMLTGSNFDQSLQEVVPKNFKLKEEQNITHQIKAKVSKLRPLQ